MTEYEFFTLEFNNISITNIFLCLVILVGVFIIVYTRYYILLEFRFGYYLIIMFGFLISIVSLLFCSRWLVLILSWEGLGIRRFFLINYYQTWERYNNSLITLITIRLGEYFLFLFLCPIALGNFIGKSSFLYSEVFIYALVLICMTKRAQVPFSGWLPKAMRAPTPTSALVHSSTLVTAGLILLINYSDLLLNNTTISFLLWAGFTTMIVGRFLALTEYRVKKLVAYSTLSQMGLGMIVCGIGNFYGGYLNLIAHGFAKSLLFIQVGYVIHCSANNQNWRSWNRSGTLQGLIRIQLIVRLTSLCGVGFLRGMLRKEYILDIAGLNSFYFIIFFFIILSIYLTFIYSLVLYKVLYNIGITSTTGSSFSVVILIVTLLEFTLVVFYFTWAFLNFVNLSPGFGGLELFTPILVLFIIIYTIPLIMNYMVNYKILNVLFLSLSNLQHYRWLCNILPFVSFLESGLYSLNSRLVFVVAPQSKGSLYLGGVLIMILTLLVLV